VQSRRGLQLQAAWLLVGLGLLSIGSCSAETTDARPNILLIVIDTLRASDLSLSGYERLTSPEIDKLAKNSFVFRNTVSVGANTTVGMAGIMTGRLPYFEFGQPWTDEYLFGMNRFYTQEGEIGLPSSLDSLAERLQDEGYFTAGVVTNPYLQKTYGFNQGFDVYEELMEESGYATGDKVTDAALDLLRSIERRNSLFGPPGPDRHETAKQALDRLPFFLYLHYMDVHGPYNPPVRLANCFGDSETALESTPWTSAKWQNWERQTENSEEKLIDQLPEVKKRYDCSIRFVDEQIGRVLSQLREFGLDKNTIIVITSDHGEEFLEHGGTTHKGTVYQELLRVPLIFHVPGVAPASTDDLVRNFDLTPTLLFLAGAQPTPSQFDAVSLLPLLRQEQETLGLSAYTSFPWARMYLEDGTKIIERPEGNVSVFDLDKDPSESNPQSLKTAGSSSRKLQERLDSLLATLRQSAVTREETKSSSAPKAAQHGPDEATRKQLRALGYLD
jgi:arylsulfatase A-like enzyme